MEPNPYPLYERALWEAGRLASLDQGSAARTIYVLECEFSSSHQLKVCGFALTEIDEVLTDSNGTDSPVSHLILTSII